MPDIPFPVVIDVERYQTDCRRDSKNCNWVQLPPKQAACYKIEFDGLPGDAISTEAFFSSVADRYTKVIVYSACRDVTLYVSTDGDACSGRTPEKRTFKGTADFVARLRIADPSHVQTIQFPDKGKIDMHTSCGVNVTSERTDSGNVFSVISEMLKQAKSIKERPRINLNEINRYPKIKDSCVYVRPTAWNGTRLCAPCRAVCPPTLYVYYFQSSTFNPLIRLNSSVLLVTSVKALETACAAISISYGPINLPSCLS